MATQELAFERKVQYGWAQQSGTGNVNRYDMVFNCPNYAVVSYDDTAETVSNMEDLFGAGGIDPGSPFIPDSISVPYARAPYDHIVVNVTGDGNVHPSTECERIAVNDDISRTLPAVFASGAELRDGHRIRFIDPFGNLGGVLPTNTLTIATADSATFRQLGSAGGTLTTSTTGVSVELELVKGSNSDGSDSVWHVIGDGGGAFGL